MKIGFFDSGLGGISVLAEALCHLDGQQWLFLADEDHVPYGEKSSGEILDLALNNARFLIREGVDALLVACNTATAVAIEDIRREASIPVVGMEPAVKPALMMEEGGAMRVLVAATPLTLREEKLRRLLVRYDHSHLVDTLPLPGLVTLAERGEFEGEGPEGYLRDEFSHINILNYRAVVLGCTHFIFFAPIFRKLLGPRIELVDGNLGTVRRLMDVLGLFPAKARHIPESTDSLNIRWFRSCTEVTGTKEALRYEAVLKRAISLCA